VADNVATVLAAGAVTLPCKPPLIGENEIAAGPCGVATVEPLDTGGNPADGDVGDVATVDGSADDPPPPPHPTTQDAKASSAAEYFAVPPTFMVSTSGVHQSRLVSNAAQIDAHKHGTVVHRIAALASCQSAHPVVSEGCALLTSVPLILRGVTSMSRLILARSRRARHS
jgi:hypothetical protein